MKYTSLLTLLLATTFFGCYTTNTIAWWAKKDLEPKVFTKLVVYVNASSLPKKSTLERAVADVFVTNFLDAVAANDVLPDLVIDSATNPASLVSRLDSVKADILLQIDYEKEVRNSININNATSVGITPYPYGWTGMGVYNQNSASSPVGAMAVNRLIDAKTGIVLMIVETGASVDDHANLDFVGSSLGRALVMEFNNRAIEFAKPE